MESLNEMYNGTPEVTAYLKAVENDILDNLEQFVRRGAGAGEPSEQLLFSMPWMREDPYKKYEVNVVIDNSETKGAPVIMETNPTYPNLLGRTEKEAQFGALTTDFSMIRGGSIHKANGGYLIVPVEDLLRNPFSYDGLKKDLKDGKIVIEEPEERYGFLSVKTLKPQPIPLSAKVIIIGDPYIYQMMFQLDTDFRELFKIKAEFDTTMERSVDNVCSTPLGYALFARKKDSNTSMALELQNLSSRVPDW